MPRSLVIYTSREGFSRLSATLAAQFGKEAIRPYTLSFRQQAGGEKVRVRITELADSTVMPVIRDMTSRAEADLAGPADREMSALSYGELRENGDRFRRSATLLFSSPTLMEMNGQATPFPVVPLLFDGYRAAWNLFSDTRIEEAMEIFRHVGVTDFKVSCAATQFGAAFEGWVTLTVEKGRTEEELSLFNTLIDFAFFCGTGLHTGHGLGQTRRAQQKLRS
jgi:hypothetical protein